MTDPRSLVEEKDAAREPPEARAEPMEADQAQEALDEVQGLLARFRLIDITARESDAEAGV